MATVRKVEDYKVENPNDPNVRDPEHAHELGGTLGMTVGGLAGGIAAGAAVGAAISGPAAPLGAIVGAAIGGAIGGSTGESIARSVNPTVEEQYWETAYVDRPYIVKGKDFETYRPAYRYGVDSYVKYEGKEFDTIEPKLKDDWSKARGKTTLEWNEARDASRDAYDRLNTRSDIK